MYQSTSGSGSHFAVTLVREGGNGRAFTLQIVERVSAPIDGTICDQIPSEWTQFDVSLNSKLTH